jgi:hypothetical protein
MLQASIFFCRFLQKNIEACGIQFKNCMPQAYISSADFYRNLQKFKISAEDIGLQHTI